MYMFGDFNFRLNTKDVIEVCDQIFIVINNKIPRITPSQAKAYSYPNSTETLNSKLKP